MGKVIGKVLGMDDSAARRAAEEARRAAEAEQRRYEEQAEKQKQMAMLEAAKQTENVVNVQTGTGVVEDYLQGPKRKRTTTASSSLGIQ